MSVTCRLYRNGGLEETSVEPARVSDLLREPGALVWVDVERPGTADIALLGEEFGFHELALEDCVHPHQRAKAEQYDSYLFAVVYGFVAGDRGFAQHEVAAFAGRNFLVTVRKDPPFDLATAARRCEARPELTAEGGGYLLYALLDEIVDGYFRILESYEDRMEAVEDTVLDPKAGPAAQAELFRIRKELVRFRRHVAPLREVLDTIMRDPNGIATPALEPYYRDVYDHVLRVTDFIDTEREALSTALESYLSAVSNRLNQVMKSVTSWAAIILVPTLVAGIYGMNFRHMPELDWWLGYPLALGIMAGAAALLYRMFRRRDWL